MPEPSIGEDKSVQHSNVVICGGGLAGLTLALQLRQQMPEASVTVVERIPRPLPKACHKVGESSVELGSHYFGEVLGLRSFLEKEHLLKNGLRFFAGNSRLPIAERTEIGPSEFPIANSYQLDRGKFETELREMCVEQGAVLLEGAKVTRVELAEEQGVHRVLFKTSEGEASELSCDFLVDASGRRRLLQRKLGLERESTNKASAAWFRISRRLKVKDLVPEAERTWHQKDIDDNRWLSTIHLCGRGYWAWIIPLSTEFTSVGIVADSENHGFDSIWKEEAARSFLRDNEPALAEALSEDAFEDFRVMKDYAYSSEQIFDARWSCVGEAGLFVDPLYSLGSDFLALSNGFTMQLIRDHLAGESDTKRVKAFNDIHIALADNAERMLRDNGLVFVHPEVFGAKLWWDFFFYWSWMCRYAMADLFALPTEELERFHELGRQYFELNSRAQTLVETWAELRGEAPTEGRPFVPLPMFPSVLADQHVDLHTKRTPDETYTKMKEDLEVGKELVAEIVIRATRDLGDRGAAVLADKTGLAQWGLPFSDERIAVDDLKGAKRRRSLPRITRDLERALGPADRSESLAQLLGAAGVRPHPEPMRSVER